MVKGATSEARRGGSSVDVLEQEAAGWLLILNGSLGPRMGVAGECCGGLDGSVRLDDSVRLDV